MSALKTSEAATRILRHANSVGLPEPERVDLERGEVSLQFHNQGNVLRWADFLGAEWTTDPSYPESYRAITKAKTRLFEADLVLYSVHARTGVRA